MLDFSERFSKCEIKKNRLLLLVTGVGSSGVMTKIVYRNRTVIDN